MNLKKCIAGGVGMVCWLAGSVQAADWYVATDGNDSAPGTNWTTAKLTIQAGVDASTDGDTVWVSNGVYATDDGRVAVGTSLNRVAIDKPVTVRSLTGPESTFIEGRGVGGNMRCVYVTNGAILSGFTVANGEPLFPPVEDPDFDGGGVWSEPNGVISNCVLTGNFTEGGGGGAYGGTLYRCTLIHNRSSFGGGGASFGTLYDCMVVSNSMSDSGAGVASSTLYDCSLIGNGTSTRGGGAYLSTLNNCTITGNSAYEGGGGAYGSTLNNCLLTGNSAVIDGGGAYGGTLNNCTVVSNATYDEWGFYSTSGGGSYNSSLNNCVVYDNTSVDTDPNWSGGTIQTTCTTPLPSGTGNITDDPQFVDAAAGNYRLQTNSPCINAGDNAYVEGTMDIDGNPRVMHGLVDMGAYELDEGGPVLMTLPIVINIGNEVSSSHEVQVLTDVAWTATTNVPWISIISGHSGSTNGTIVFGVTSNTTHTSRVGGIVLTGGGVVYTCTVVQDETTLLVTLSPSIISLDSGAATGITVDVTANLSWTASTNAPWLVITSGQSGTTDGTVLFNIESNSFAVVRTGAIIVSGGVQSRTCQVIQAAGSVTPTNWYVATNGSDAAVGYSWATAKQTIQAGVDAALDGDTVWVSNGVYATGGGNNPGGTGWTRLPITKAITVRSVNGPVVTTIVGNGMRAVFVTDGAVLSGFTVTNGIANNGYCNTNIWNFGGGVFCRDAGVVENCVLSGNFACVKGGGVYGGTLNSCLIVGNYSSLGGGASDSILNSCTVVDNTSEYCGGVYDGTANNSIIYDNSSSNGYNLNYLSSSVFYSCTSPDPGGTGNITNDPQFVDAAVGNYRIQSNSPCINAGENALVSGTTDLDGNSRIMDGIVDMGAYEIPLAVDIHPASTNLSFESASGITIDVTASVSWTATTNVPWLTITSGDMGATNGTIIFNVASNGTAGTRTGAVIVAGGGLSRTCTVVQAPFIPVLEISPTSTNLSSSAASGLDIEVTANMAWSATTNVPWLSVTSGGSGATNGTVFFSVAANGLTASRTGAVIVAGGGLSLTCTVVQTPFIPMLEISPTSTNLPFEAAGALGIEVTANVSWNATTNMPWLSITAGDSGTTNGTVIFNVASNVTAATRTGAVIVVGGGLSLTCTVVQTPFIPMLEINPSSMNLPLEAASGLGIEVTANISWTSSATVPWLDINSGDLGSTNGTIFYSVEANGLTASRTGAVIVAGGGLSRTCTVVQAAFIPQLEIENPSPISVDYHTYSLYIQVAANIPWDASTNAPWLSIPSGDSGTTNGTIILNVASNGTITPRSGDLIVVGGGLTRTYTVMQGGGYPFLEIMRTQTNLPYSVATGLVIEVSANVTWVASTNVPWLEITSGLSGNGDGTITVSVASNTTGRSRRGYVFVEGGGLSRTFQVIQDRLVLRIEPPSIHAPIQVAAGYTGLLRTTNDWIWVVGTKPTNTWVAKSSSPTGDTFSTSGILQQSAGTTWSNLIERTWTPPDEVVTWYFRCEPLADHTLNSGVTILRGTAAGYSGAPDINITSTFDYSIVPSCHLTGFRNAHTLEQMWMSNQANGATASFTAPDYPATNWTSSTLPLKVGTNMLQVFGTNMLGDVAMDQHEVILVVYAGSVGLESNGAVRLDWTMSTNISIPLQWQRSTNLLGGVWTNVGAPFTATQEVESLIESNFNGKPAFFRLQLTGP
jgi:Putative binding domain, N-terminal/Viral BACON domain